MTTTRYPAASRAPAKRNQDFNRALLDEAASLFLRGDSDGARRMLRGLVQASIGFDGLAQRTGKPAQSLQRMLAADGNPSMENLAAIFAELSSGLNVRYSVRVVDASRQRPTAPAPAGRYAHRPTGTLTSAP